MDAWSWSAYSTCDLRNTIIVGRCAVDKQSCGAGKRAQATAHDSRQLDTHATPFLTLKTPPRNILYHRGGYPNLGFLICCLSISKSIGILNTPLGKYESAIIWAKSLTDVYFSTFHTSHHIFTFAQWSVEYPTKSSDEHPKLGVAHMPLEGKIQKPKLWRPPLVISNEENKGDRKRPCTRLIWPLRRHLDSF